MFTRILGARLREPDLLAVLCSACISRLASRSHNIPPDVHLPPEDRLQTPPPQAMAPRANASPPAVYCSVCLSRVASPLALHPAEHITPAGESLTDTRALKKSCSGITVHVSLGDSAPTSRRFSTARTHRKLLELSRRHSKTNLKHTVKDAVTFKN